MKTQQIRDYNVKRYKGVPPSFDAIKNVLHESGLSVTRFEKAYGMSHGTIGKHLRGERGLAPTWWHLIYEFGNLEKFYSNFKVKSVKRSTPKKQTPAQIIINEKNKSLIDAYRGRIA